MSDLVTSRIFVDGEKGITAAKLNDITASSVIQPAFYTGKPTASTADPADVMLHLKAGAYTQVPVSTLAASISTSQIWATRLRSFNAAGNCSFECDQRSVGATVAAANGLVVDRWAVVKSGTLVVSGGQQPAAAGDVLVPGTNFAISRSFLRVTLTTAEASLGVGDYLMIRQLVEGPPFRELQYDVHSVSLLVRSSVAGLKFGLFLQDPATTSKSLLKLCTIPSANTWTLISLPNLPIWPAGNFTSAPGANGYVFGICLAAGSTYTASAADTWQNGNFLGAPGQSNFAASPVNSTFDIAFVQHEPGPVCTTFIDKPFSQNYDECLRYFCKSYDYATALGTNTGLGVISGWNGVPSVAGTDFRANVMFPKPMAASMGTAPVLSGAGYYTWTVAGVGNGVRDVGGAADRGVVTLSGSSTRLSNLTLSANLSANSYGNFHYKADTGW